MVEPAVRFTEVHHALSKRFGDKTTAKKPAHYYTLRKFLSPDRGISLSAGGNLWDLFYRESVRTCAYNRSKQVIEETEKLFGYTYDWRKSAYWLLQFRQHEEKDRQQLCRIEDLTEGHAFKDIKRGLVAIGKVSVISACTHQDC